VVGAKADRLSTIGEIAQSFDISNTHLMKVVNKLGQQGYIDTVRGKGGGIRLGRAPAQIRVGAVVRDTEEELAVMGCISGPGFCRIEGCCVLRGALRNATLAFLETLDGYTLADLLAPRAKLARSLGIAPEMGSF
jgi:Rrf2 family nitric oxide-sensitive transcriptional repressor